MNRRLPGQPDLEINEVYLSHGSKPETVPAILAGGLNERFSGGLFGHGTYFAEDIAKNDQYCTQDVHYGAYPDLHKELFDKTNTKHAGNLFYVFVCRVVLGKCITTKNGKTTTDNSGIWSSQNRELAIIPGSSPPVIYHSLLAEKGEVV